LPLHPFQFIFIAYLLIALFFGVQGTVPPAALFVGMGYDILKGNPDGDSHINAGKDPGLLMTRQILKLDPPNSPREISYHEYPLCYPTYYREVFYGTKSYQSRLLHDLIDIGMLNLSVFSVQLHRSFYKRIFPVVQCLTITGNTPVDIKIQAFTLSEGDVLNK
jgi:hypothetical protein